MKYKLLFIWPDLGDGGGERALINLVNILKNKYQIHILCCDDVNVFNLSNDINVTFVCKTSKKRIVRLYNKFLFLLKWRMIAKNYDLQIINEVPVFSIMAWLVSLVTQKKYLIWVHSCRDEMRAGSSRLFEFIHRKSLFYASGLIFVSNYAAKSMCNYVGIPLKTLSVIHNILQFNVSESNGSVLLPKDIIKVCAVGRLTHEKNFSLLLDALAKALPLINNTVHLYIYGQGNELEALTKKVKRLKLTGYVTFAGYVSNVVEYIKQCDIFVSSSNSEALPTVICEALYFNKAVIATDTGANEILENGKFGIVVQRKNILMLSNALVKLINDKDLRERYAINAKRGLDKFDSLVIEQQWCDLINRTL